MRRMLLSGVACGALLAGCGSGGGGTPPTGGVPTPPPVQSPGPPPAPPPTPAPTPPPPAYTTFANLAGTQTFQSTCSTRTPGAFSAPAPAFQWLHGLTFDYQSGPESWAISGHGHSLTFGPADRDSSAPAGVIAYRKNISGSPPERFVLSRPTAGAVGLDYLRSAIVTTTRFGSPTEYHCVIGVPTRTADVPPTTINSYSLTGISGVATVRGTNGEPITYSLHRSTVTIDVNLTDRRVTSTLRLIGTPVSGPDVSLIVITGTGTIDPSTGGYYGDLRDGDRDASGTFSGAFFGPQGRETAYSFTLSGRDASAVGNFTAGGLAFGIR